MKNEKKQLSSRIFSMEWEGVKWLVLNAEGTGRVFETALIKLGKDLEASKSTLAADAFMYMSDRVHTEMLLFKQYRPVTGLMLFIYEGPSKGWAVTMYRVPNSTVDLNSIAARYGGGRHRNACGFVCKVLPFWRQLG